jgi:hypothetical protein
MFGTDDQYLLKTLAPTSMDCNIAPILYQLAVVGDSKGCECSYVSARTLETVFPS